MPRDSGGNYALPDGYLAITGETITALQHNPPLEDIAQALTNSLARNGSSAMTGDLTMGGNDIKNAGDADFDTATLGVATIGAATIGALALGGNANAGSHKIVGLATGTANDDAATVLQATGWAPLASGTTSGVGEQLIDLTARIAAGYRRFRIILGNLKLSSGTDALRFALSADGGSTYFDTGYRYQGQTVIGDFYVDHAYSEADVGDDGGYIDAGLDTSSFSHAWLDLNIQSAYAAWAYNTASIYTGGNTGKTTGSGQLQQGANAILLWLSNSATFTHMDWTLEGQR